MKYPWKQCTTSGANPLRDWTRGRQNTLLRWRGGGVCPCQGCTEDARRYAALMRLVERKAGGRCRE